MAQKKLPKVRKKPTARELAGALIEVREQMNTGVQQALDYTNHVDRVFGLYLDFKGEREAFEEHINNLVEKEKDEQKGDGKADPENILANPEDAGSGAEGVRPG